jgi:phospholipid-translocating ATPase
MEGLRTLVLTQRGLQEPEYENFSAELEEARAILTDDREAQIQAVITKFEAEMEFLCVTGVEDKLQEDVLKTVE